MKQRLIDADAFKQLLQISEGLEIDGYGNIRTNVNALNIAIERSTIDAEPVRHGKWIGYAGTIGNECSVCGKWIDVLQGTAEMNYCPNCGARMDGDRNEPTKRL